MASIAIMIKRVSMPAMTMAMTMKGKKPTKMLPQGALLNERYFKSRGYGALAPYTTKMGYNGMWANQKG